MMGYPQMLDLKRAVSANSVETMSERSTDSDSTSLKNAALLLDIDGTLVLTDDIYFAVFTDLLAPYGYKVDQEFYVKNVHGKVDADVFKALMPSHYGPKELKAVSEKKDALFCAKAKELGVPIIPGLGAALAMAKKAWRSMHCSDECASASR
jgi:beta-phosphoglucomutase-like phosphatase (HAD superfamily)